jgi:hypothetical protein
MASTWEDREPVGLDDRLQWAQAELESINGRLELIDQRAGEAITAMHDLFAEQHRRTGTLGTIAVLLLLVLVTLWWKL